MKFSDFVIVSILCSPEEIVLCFNYSSYQKQKKILKNVTSSSLDKNNKIKQRIPKTCINAVTFILHPLLKDCFSTVFFYLPSSKYCCMLLRNFSLFLPLFFFLSFIALSHWFSLWCWELHITVYPFILVFSHS